MLAIVGGRSSLCFPSISDRKFEAKQQIIFKYFYGIWQGLGRLEVGSLRSEVGWLSQKSRTADPVNHQPSTVNPQLSTVNPQLSTYLTVFFNFPYWVIINCVESPFTVTAKR
ncbi:hypothetical protein SAMN05661099_3083 [Daejeonella lutea]|uniref:Uncharacterized protein n=1 Tax=Daejeonella lutea TaxID=572036 RepID=A0A1T5ENJ7_9SPHI|nr:hypothetical protein SAMN05661099_3083 [Daejeonella lutea]